jgi:uncharacterized membrane protein
MTESLPLAITGYEFGLFLHITAVMVGFGATFAESIMFPVAMKAGARHLPYVHRLQIAINLWLATPALAVVLVSGLYLVGEGDWGFDQAWISAALLIVVVVGALLGVYFIPTDRELGPLAERDIAASREGEVVLSEEYQRKARFEGIMGSITGVLLVVAVYLMVVKPGA